MLTRVLFFSIALSYSALCFSQAEDKKKATEKTETNAYLGLSGGFTIPMGSLANYQKFSTEPFIENGSNFHLFDFGFQFKESLGIKVFYLRANNSFDENILANNLSSTSSNSYQAEVSNIELNAMAVGLGVTKASTSLDLDMHFMLAFGNTFSPTYKLTETNSQTNQSQEIFIESRKKKSFGAGLSIGIRIHLSDKIDLTTQAAYLIFGKRFDEITIVEDELVSFKEQFSYEILTVNFGLAYRFQFQPLKN